MSLNVIFHQDGSITVPADVQARMDELWNAIEPHLADMSDWQVYAFESMIQYRFRFAQYVAKRHAG